MCLSWGLKVRIVVPYRENQDMIEDRRIRIDRFADALVTNLDAVLRAYRRPVVFVEVDESPRRLQLSNT